MLEVLQHSCQRGLFAEALPGGIENQAIDVLIVETFVPHTSLVAYNTLSNNDLFATLTRNGGIKSRAH